MRHIYKVVSIHVLNAWNTIIKLIQIMNKKFDFFEISVYENIFYVAPLCYSTWLKAMLPSYLPSTLYDLEIFFLK